MTQNLSDYPNPTWERVGPDTGANGVHRAGPLVSPIKAPGCKGGLIADPLQDIAQNIRCIKDQGEADRYLQSIIVDLLGASYIPKYGIQFDTPSGAAVAVAAAGQSSSTVTTIQTLTLDEGYEGFLKEIGVAIFPETAWTDVTIQVTINGTVVPKFAAQTFLNNSIADPMPLHVALPMGCKILVTATNSGSTALYGASRLVGWTKPIRRT